MSKNNPPIGCGWDDRLAEYGRGQPTEDNKVPCAARDGYIRLFPFNEDVATIGNVGLCTTCLETPADLLAKLAKWIKELDLEGSQESDV